MLLGLKALLAMYAIILLYLSSTIHGQYLRERDIYEFWSLLLYTTLYSYDHILYYIISDQAAGILSKAVCMPADASLHAQSMLHMCL